jgi:23S rRNA G2069 N7-methylase RlmK/C1962 C5-methylase RlmI
MDKTAAQGEMFFNRIVKRYRHLQKWAKRTGTNAYRLYDRDIPEIPLVLDLYGDAVSLALYRRPYEKEDEEIWLSVMKAAAAQALDIPGNCIFLKERQRMRGRQQEGSQYDRISKQGFYRDVIENHDLRFRVNLSDYLDTGLFLDARKRRALIRRESSGKRVLDLFAYTCTLSVSAAKGGAIQVDAVDLSKTYLEWGKANFTLNGFKTRFSAFTLPSVDGFNLIRSDVMVFLDEAVRKAWRWDLIVLDCPSFSNSKKMKGTLDIQRDHRNLIQRCLSLLNPGGTLWFSANSKNFKIEDADFSSLDVKDLTEELIDEDFKGKRVPCCYAFATL